MVTISKQNFSQFNLGVIGLVGLPVLMWLFIPKGYFVIRDYLPFHMAAETFSIVVSFVIFAVAWHAHSGTHGNRDIFLGCGLVSVAILDFFHMLSYAGMPDFVTPAGVEKAINFWLSARLFTSLILLAVALKHWHASSSSNMRYRMLALNLTICTLISYSILYQQNIWPSTYHVSTGLTEFKLVVESFVMVLLLLPLWRFFKEARLKSSIDAYYLFVASALTIVSEFCFTLYADPNDVFNALGHLYKILAYSCIFRSVFVSSVRQPYWALDTALSENRKIAVQLTRHQEHLEELVIERTSQLQQANQALEAFNHVVSDELREAELRYHTLFCHAQDGIVLIEGETNLIVECNAEFERQTRRNLAELKLCHIWEVCSLASQPTMQKYLVEQVKATGQVRFEIDFQGDNGLCLPSEVSATAVQMGGRVYIQCICRDISERKQNEIALKHAHRALTTLLTVNKMISHADSESDLLQGICQIIVQQQGYQMAWIGYVDQYISMPINIVAQSGSTDNEIDIISSERVKHECVSMFAQQLNVGRECQIYQDVANDSRCLAWRASALMCGYRACLAISLHHNSGEVLGVLSVYASEAGAFDEENLHLLEKIANDTAFGVCALRMRKQHEVRLNTMQQQWQQLEHQVDEVVRVISLMVEVRDPYTAGHQSRVAALSRAIALKLELDEDTAHGIYLAGFIHDVGKIQIPAEILTKPGTLKSYEFELLKNHVQIGYEILKNIDFPWPIAQMVLQHHERVNGTGYPQKLIGEQIIMGARIIAVADVVEAMSFHRPYRPSEGVDSALKEIQAGKGIVYDSVVADACISLFRNGEFDFSS